jgi:putative protease
MRRDAIDLLSEEKIKIKDRKYKDKKISYNPKIKSRNNESKLRIKVKNLEQLKASFLYNLDVIYYEDINTLDEAVKLSKNYNTKIVYSSPRIVRNREYYQFDKVKIDDIQASSLGAINYFKNNNFSVDYYLNAFNSESINHYKDEGAKCVCISQELNINEIKETIKYTDANIESVVYGYVPMMISEYCPMGVIVRDCKKDKRISKCREINYALRSLNGEKYKVSQDNFCRSTIYNSNVTCMLDNLYELNEIGIDIFRLDFTVENENEVKEVIEAHIEVLENGYKLGEKSTKLYDKLDKIGITAGHYYKGVE